LQNYTKTKNPFRVFLTKDTFKPVYATERQKIADFYELFLRVKEAAFAASFSALTKSFSKGSPV